MQSSPRILFAALFLFVTTSVRADRQDYKVYVRGETEKTFYPPRSNDPAERVDNACSGKTCDTVVVGSGLAGLSSAFFLGTKHKKDVLVLELSGRFGGLASGATDDLPELTEMGLAEFAAAEGGVSYDRGAAYWTDSYDEEQAILEAFGLGGFRGYPRMGKKGIPSGAKIPEPADSYFWNGKMYPGIWEEETMKVLPASFLLFHHELKLTELDGLIPNQPIEEYVPPENYKGPAPPHLDTLNAAQWVRMMPTLMEKRLKSKDYQAELKKMLKEAEKQNDKVAAYVIKDLKEAYERYEAELKAGTLDAKDPMKDVIGLLDLYCRSALGSEAEDVSAVAFANFYSSEIVPRYTSELGTGAATAKMLDVIKGHKNVILQANSPVQWIRQDNDYAYVTYLNRLTGKAYEVRTKYVVFAAQIDKALGRIEGFEKKDPKRAEILGKLAYSHYSVHNVFVDGHPYRMTYDTWTRAKDYTNDDFTDVILGRWMNPKIKGYAGMRDFKKNPSDNVGIFTIYHPLPQKYVGKRSENDKKAVVYDHPLIEKLARQATDRMLELYNPKGQPFSQSNEEFPEHTILIEKIKVKGVITNPWPFSVHIAKPGHFTRDAKILRKPFGRVLFANNNLGTPAFEEALFRGHCASDNIMRRFDSSYKGDLTLIGDDGKKHPYKSLCPME
jgi:hypothetical protein